MFYIDSYADKYQKAQGFEITIIDVNGKELDAFLSFENNTRSTYDIAMRDATIDGLVTMDNIEKLQPSQLFYKKILPSELFIIQAVNKSEQQTLSKNINAIKQNSYVTILRKDYNEKTNEEDYQNIYKDVISFVSVSNKDEKNFAPGLEDNTVYNLQIPKKNIITNEVYDVKNGDKIILEDITRMIKKSIKVESIDAFGVSGVIRIYGTPDTRSNEIEEVIDLGTDVEGEEDGIEI